MSVIDRAAIAGVFLLDRLGKELRIGALIRDANGSISFTVDESYIALGPDRPLVSVAWRGEDEAQTVARLRKTDDKMMRGGLLPPFFQNLLPEGKLRELVDSEFGAGAFDNFDVLVRLGEDLPGALVVRLEAGEPPPRNRGEPVTQPEKAIRFSLAGVQLKFSMTGAKKGLTIPGLHRGGDVILKTPSPEYPRLPEAEYSAMQLAAAAGVRTAEMWLVPADEIAGVPKEYLDGGPSLAVKRFDRTAEGGRIQIEDFAQIVGAIGDRRYTMINEETVLNIVRRFSDDSRGELLEGVRRSVVNLMLGNGDAHAKNWSFRYGAKRDIALTPAYDIVPTFLYGDDTLALQFGNTKTPYNIGLHRFERAAGLVKVEPKVMTREVRRVVELILDVWPKAMKDLPLPRKGADRIVARWQNMTLVKECTPALAK